MRRSAAGVATATGLLAGLACFAPASPAAPLAGAALPASATTATPSGTLVVSAAASLSDVFPKIAEAFTRRYPGTTVTLNFGGSATLVTQVLSGAPVDVLATASQSSMSQAINSGAVNRPFIFAKNTMAIAMPPDNPARISSLADLSRPGVLVGLCDQAVPCGTAAADLLSRNNVSVTPVTRELDVRALLAKVVSGDLDAGIVYVTDVRAVGNKVSSVSIPAAANVTTTYPIATVVRRPNLALATAFVNYVRFSRSAQGLLRAYGFGRPW